MNYEPENLNRWERPKHYFGAEWPEYYSAGVSRNRDSNCRERANFDAMIALLEGQEFEIVRESHFLVGWIEWIAIHQDDTEALKIADEAIGRLENYPVLDDYLHSEYEMEKANEVWSNCYDWRERCEYIREYRSQFDFRNLSDMIQCVRGNYFAGYASELIN